MHRNPAGLVLLAWLVMGPSACVAQRFTIELEVGGQMLEAGPLVWSAAEVLLLSREGVLLNIDPGDVRTFRRTADQFQGYPASEVRTRLRREFGRAFDISSTAHYLVVHPAGYPDVWGPRFEQLFRAFSRYFATRGWKPEEPRFPLVAVVLPGREEFLQHASAERATLLPGTVGYYSVKTNRVVLYDQDSDADGGWQTVLHEATHQIAFNTGIHSRFSPPPLWVAEGLSTLFEAAGVWNSRQSLGRHDRLHPAHLPAFQRFAAKDLQRMGIAEFVSSDESFAAAPPSAYATSWALTFFLAETVPHDYTSYLRALAERPPFAPYRAEERLADFRRAFGENLPLIEARLMRYATGLASAQSSRN